MGDHEIALARLTLSLMPDLVAMELWGGCWVSLILRLTFRLSLIGGR